MEVVDHIAYNMLGVLVVNSIWIILHLLYLNFENKRKKRLQFAMLAYQSHTNPHFIKNILQTINWFVLNNEKNKASDYLCDFSNLMEDILRFSKENFIVLTDKLNFLDQYLKLQNLRHLEKFDFIPMNLNLPTSNINLSENINSDVFLLPPMLIHPFVENAIEHGLQPKKKKGFIKIDFSFENNCLQCMISDNGIGIKASESLRAQSKISRSSIGVINAKKRIEVINKLFNINISVKVEELIPGDKEPGTKVSISLNFPLSFNPQKGFPKEIYL